MSYLSAFPGKPVERCQPAQCQCASQPVPVLLLVETGVPGPEIPWHAAGRR